MSPSRRKHSASWRSRSKIPPFKPAAQIQKPAPAPKISRRFNPQSAIRNPQIEKSAAFAALRERALACVKCPHLASSRKNVVFGVGSIDAQLMFVGEAPGADEDEQGEPFVGKAGQLLTKIIQATGLSRADVYIANILKCRPDTPGQSAGNRKPTPEEMQTCIPYLHEQIDLIRPKVIVALGATAVEGLLGKTIGITKLRGNWQTYRGTPLMPTYHPAYLLRNQAMSEKRARLGRHAGRDGKARNAHQRKAAELFSEGMKFNRVPPENFLSSSAALPPKPGTAAICSSVAVLSRCTEPNFFSSAALRRSPMPGNSSSTLSEIFLSRNCAL